MRTDILLLADVMENFRASSLKTYGLDPAWYYTMPGYTWDCMLKYTGCKLYIIKDIYMVMFVEQAIRGGVSVCCNRRPETDPSSKPGTSEDLSRDSDVSDLASDFSKVKVKRPCGAERKRRKKEREKEAIKAPSSSQGTSSKFLGAKTVAERRPKDDLRGAQGKPGSGGPQRRSTAEGELGVQGRPRRREARGVRRNGCL
ncbi:unnamed protein product [Phaedon cochleariae]|uniref:Uncharacterized protein n=1 Tax=Phaedon cochleariae TaxID=80249 RepID=A0A9N9SCC2_PHACE|nr:unnamed protein product [Phaedon cochleariae]